MCWGHSATRRAPGRANNDDDDDKGERGKDWWWLWRWWATMYCVIAHWASLCGYNVFVVYHVHGGWYETMWHICGYTQTVTTGYDQSTNGSWIVFFFFSFPLALHHTLPWWWANQITESPNVWFCKAAILFGIVIVLTVRTLWVQLLYVFFLFQGKSLLVFRASLFEKTHGYVRGDRDG